MLTVYGTLMPLRLLEEIRFWKMQEKEHTVVIRELTTGLEAEYVTLLKEWEPVFAETEFRAQEWIEALVRGPAGVTPYAQMQVEGLLNSSLEQSRQFVNQLMYMMSHSHAIQTNPTAQVVIQHIIRESEYFLGVLHAFTMGTTLAGGILPTDAGSPGRQHGLGQAFASATFFPWKQTGYNESIDLHLSRSAAQEQEQGRDPSPATGEGSWSQAAMGAPASSPSPAEQHPVPIGGHTLPPLPYAYNALEPYIDTETMRLHHDKHHQSYVDGLNKAELKLAEARRTGDFSLVKHWEREAAFHGAGHYLHTIFWQVMAPHAGGPATGPINAQLEADFGGFASFKKHFSAAAEQVEGGGWAILAWSPRSHRLVILQAEKHQNLSQWDVIPLLVLDVWEHAYYLKHANKRAAYIEDWWHLVNWREVNHRFETARTIRWTPY